MNRESETPYERKMRMLLQLQQTCNACTMCELGRRDAIKNDVARDPHVLSNMNPTRFVVVGQNPGWGELEKREPFVGQSGQTFDTEIEKNGLSRKDFYITNIVKCWTEGNEQPQERHTTLCQPFINMELNLIKPLLVITLGAVAFNNLCPKETYSDCLKKITPSKYGFNVYAIYHPSPVNLADPDRKKAFQEQVRILCALVKRLKAQEENTLSQSS